jgi:hypothetical protein
VASRRLTPSKLKALSLLCSTAGLRRMLPVRYSANTRSQIARIAGSVRFDVLKTKAIVSEEITAGIRRLVTIEFL